MPRAILSRGDLALCTARTVATLWPGTIELQNLTCIVLGFIRIMAIYAHHLCHSLSFPPERATPWVAAGDGDSISAPVPLPQPRRRPRLRSALRARDALEINDSECLQLRGRAVANSLLPLSKDLSGQTLSLLVQVRVRAL